MTKTGNTLEFDQVSMTVGQGAQRVEALSGIDLRVRRGEFVAVTGRSGSGKSTLLNLAGGIDVATSGSVLVDGVDMSAASATARAALRRRSLGFVFQNLNLLPALSARENITLPLEFDGWKGRKAREAADEVLERVGLGDMGARHPDELSGGEQQRVAIARAIVGDRTLLLADEPTGALDELSGESIAGLLADIASSGDAAVVMVTHDPGLAAWADRVVRLSDGRIDMITERSSTPPTPAELLS